jgi:hypothetical protein
MHKKLISGTLLLLTVTLAALLAADAVTGKWTMEQAGRGGGPPRVTTFDLKADGAKLSGTATIPGFGRGGDTPPPPTTTPISNGKLDGNNVSFEVTREFGGNSFTTKYEGAITGNEMKLKITFPGFNGGEPRTIEAAAKKAN